MQSYQLDQLHITLDDVIKAFDCIGTVYYFNYNIVIIRLYNKLKNTNYYQKGNPLYSYDTSDIFGFFSINCQNSYPYLYCSLPIDITTYNFNRAECLGQITKPVDDINSVKHWYLLTLTKFIQQVHAIGVYGLPTVKSLELKVVKILIS